LDIESREIRDERRNVTERVQVDYRNGYLLEVYYLGTVKYSFSTVQFRNEYASTGPMLTFRIIF
jgi:hypothetical protein